MESKAEFRKKAIERLKSIGKGRRYIYDKTINDKLMKLILEEGAESVMIYIPMDMEPDITPLIGRLRREGISVYVPFMVAESFVLVKYRLPLYKKRFGIREPKISRQYRKRRIDIAIVPIVGTDRTFRRVGFGRGMYDRFFEKEKKYIGRVVFVERLLCMSPSIVTQNHDIKADILITADTLIRRVP